jgi:hypothetical protein
MCLTPFSTLFQLYSDGHLFICRGTGAEYSQKVTDLLQIADKFCDIQLYQVHLSVCLNQACYFSGDKH